MTWKEFREQVEKEMEEKGINEDEEIWYIDVSSTFLNPDEDKVHFDQDCGIAIS